MGADIMIGTGIVDIEFDKNKLSEILNIRKFIYNNDEQAAEFLENIDKSRPVFKKSAKPELPF